MNLFQWIALPVLACLCILDFVGWMRGHGWWNVRLLRALAWLASALAIYDPDRLTWVASFLGIHRGADLVLYLFALGLVGAVFFFYGRYVRLQRQLTDLARHIAIQEARRSTVAPRQ